MSPNMFLMQGIEMKDSLIVCNGFYDSHQKLRPRAVAVVFNVRPQPNNVSDSEIGH